MSNFNFIAPYYDWLAKGAFGTSIEQANSLFLQEITSEDQVLILGGGTGKLLEDIPVCEKLIFVEHSASMLGRARTRDCRVPVEFVQEDFFKFGTTVRFDWVICPFFLDCFREDNLVDAIKLIKALLQEDGKANSE